MGVPHLVLEEAGEKLGGVGDLPRAEAGAQPRAHRQSHPELPAPASTVSVHEFPSFGWCVRLGHTFAAPSRTVSRIRQDRAVPPADPATACRYLSSTAARSV